MNRMLVTHSTAIKYWRTHELEETSATRASVPPSISTQHEIDEVLLHALGFDTSDTHLLISGDTPRGSISGVTFHHWKGSLPRGALRKIREGVLVVSPEMCFLFAAQEMSLYYLILYGMEICGTYTIDENTSRNQRYNKESLTSTARIEAFLKRCGSHKGVCLARKALRFVLDGSASPMETALAMLLCMPPRYGGYGIPRPTLNGIVPLGARMQRYSDAGYNKCDLYWPSDNLVVEYDSTEFHYGEAKRTKDVKRSNILEHAGKRVITVTWQIVVDPEELEKTAEMIAKALSHRLNKRVDRRAFVQARNQLRKAVLPKQLERSGVFL